MNSQRLGCLSPLALITATLMVLFLVAAEIISGNSMFNPGALNAKAGEPLAGVTSHAETGKDCGQCHPPFWSTQTMTDLCQDCHTHIQEEMGDPTSLHGILLQGKPRNCRSCHTEHHGPDASLTDMSTVNFPHDSTGFSLAGHQTTSGGTPFSCSDCHTHGYSTFDQQICIDCHRTNDKNFTDTHISDFGEGCLACHDGVDRYGNFDHSQVTFALSGAHLQVDCSGCHINARTISDLQNTSTSCEGCHLSDDAHAGKFGTQCGLCHTPIGWKPATFDHSLAAFQLDGKHMDVPCESCHTAGFKGTPTSCEGCHLSDDAHAGKFGTQCGLCHTPDGWKPATFDHSLADFPLEGKHMDVPCESCHTAGFKGTPTSCEGCHLPDDAHAGKFGTQCGLCHTPDGWKPATFDHSLADFPLEGKHVDVPCEQCHINGFKGTPKDCYSCHKQDDQHNGAFGTACEACHNPSDWADATFDHSLAAFQLTGAHVNVRCADCHINGVFKGTPQSCAACHPDPAFHAGLFAGMACSQCHNTTTWSNANFNLAHPSVCGEGGCVNHEGATCRDCHPSNLSTATCLACHDSNNPGDGGGGDG